MRKSNIVDPLRSSLGYPGDASVGSDDGTHRTLSEQCQWEERGVDQGDAGLETFLRLAHGVDDQPKKPSETSRRAVKTAKL
jgi:hypothetical protein